MKSILASLDDCVENLEVKIRMSWLTCGVNKDLVLVTVFGVPLVYDEKEESISRRPSS